VHKSTLKRVLSALPLVAAIAAFSSSASTQHHQQEPDGVRFRGGISAGGGGLFLGDYGLGIGGVTGRLGVQVNNLIGIYASRISRSAAARSTAAVRSPAPPAAR
jgi:hypothetical protein